MRRKINVLIFPAGEINSVELHDALSFNVNIDVFGCSSKDRHGSYVFKKYKSGLPLIEEQGFFEALNELLDEWEIDLIIPTHDTVAQYLAMNKDRIAAGIVGSPYETTKVCRDKKLTYELFHDCNFCPEIHDSFVRFPVFIKPRDGQGGQNAYRVNMKEQIPSVYSSEGYIICEYLSGRELTVDCFTDIHGDLRVCFPRERKRVFAGVCVASETEEITDEIKHIAETINERLVFRGMWYFQIKQNDQGKYKLLEVSTRCAGSMCFTRAHGINLPLLSVYVAMGREISVYQNPGIIRMDRTLISRYHMDYDYRKVYIDYDDTIINQREVCLPVIRFLYQCRNKGVEVEMLSRHEVDHDDSIEKSLHDHAIDRGLFSKITRVEENKQKIDYMRKENAIFIDNSYSERKKVHDVLRIPTYDVEGIEVLLDWRN